MVIGKIGTFASMLSSRHNMRLLGVLWRRGGGGGGRISWSRSLDSDLGLTFDIMLRHQMHLDVSVSGRGVLPCGFEVCCLHERQCEAAMLC